jgi:hypothetical protein
MNLEQIYEIYIDKLIIKSNSLEPNKKLNLSLEECKKIFTYEMFFKLKEHIEMKEFINKILLESRKEKILILKDRINENR